MKTIKVKLLEPIEGYEDVAEFRVPTLRDSAWVASTGNVCTDQALLPLATRLCLKKSQTRAERLGLEVGAVYTLNAFAIIEVKLDGSLKEHNDCPASCWGSSSDAYIKSQMMAGEFRMVICPDGTFVDDEDGGNFECIGGKWVSKADLREFLRDKKCSDKCCCDICIPC